VAFYGEAIAARRISLRSAHQTFPLSRKISQQQERYNPTTRTRWLWVSAM
jgi:hypothetical protein